MSAIPLETPLSDLSPASRVYVIRRGSVYLYPAAILLDIANDRYVLPDRPWSPTKEDWGVGEAMLKTFGRCDDSDYLEALARSLWVTAGGRSDQFEIWWDSVDSDASPDWIGAATVMAAREVMSEPLFRHRYMVDDGRMYA